MKHPKLPWCLFLIFLTLSQAGGVEKAQWPDPFSLHPEDTVPLRDGDRIGWSADGNRHDSDDWGTMAIAREINASSAQSRFWYCVAGHFEVAYRGIAAADPAKRRYCTLVSHSPGNDKKKGPWSHDRQNCENLGVEFIRIKGGNGLDSRFGGGNSHHWEVVNWLKESSDASSIHSYPDMEGVIHASWNWPFSRKSLSIEAITFKAIPL